MICSASSSSSRAARCAAIALAVALAGCRHAPAAGPPPLRLVVFPVQNATGGTAPIRALGEALETALAGRGLDVVPRAALDAVLAAHRIRWTGGVGRSTAEVLRKELGADAVLVASLEAHEDEPVPKIALVARLVSTGERPTVLWADSVAHAGNEAPGLLSLGIVTRAVVLDERAVATLARSAQQFVQRRAWGPCCGEAGRFVPRREYRAPVLDDVGRRTVAVLPFTNETSRRSAGEVVQGQFVAQLARSGAFEVLDPGFVREELLAHRIILEQGVSIDNATVLLKLLDADLVLSGFVHVYLSPLQPEAAPSVEFSAYVLDRQTQELVWSSSSNGRGDDGVFFFEAGKVRTGAALSCRMVRGVVDHIVGSRGTLTRSN